MDLHIGYETVEQRPPAQRDALDARARAAGLASQMVLTKVADLIARVARVSVETMAIVSAMRDAEREG